MAHLPSSAARTFEMHGVTFRSFAATATGATRLAAWRADFAPATPGQAHTMTEEEVLYVLTGQLDVEVDGEHATVHAGDAVLVPAGAVFRASNNTDREAGAWVTSSLGMRASMSSGGDPIAPPWTQ